MFYLIFRKFNFPEKKYGRFHLAQAQIFSFEFFLFLKNDLPLLYSSNSRQLLSKSISLNTETSLLQKQNLNNSSDHLFAETEQQLSTNNNSNVRYISENQTTSNEVVCNIPCTLGTKSTNEKYENLKKDVNNNNITSCLPLPLNLDRHRNRSREKSCYSGIPPLANTSPANRKKPFSSLKLKKENNNNTSSNPIDIDSAPKMPPKLKHSNSDGGFLQAYQPVHVDVNSDAVSHNNKYSHPELKNSTSLPFNSKEKEINCSSPQDDTTNFVKKIKKSKSSSMSKRKTNFLKRIGGLGLSCVLKI